MCLALSLTALVLIPTEVFLGNRSDLLLYLGEALLWPLGPAVGVSLLGAALLWCLRGPWRERAVALVLVGTLLLWVHAHLLVWRHEVMDGSEIDWAAYRGRDLIDAALWLVGLGLAWWQAPRLHRHAGTAAAALVAMQGMSLLVAANQARGTELDFFKGYYVEKEDRFQFSPERNVVVLLVDEYQTDIFAEAVAPKPEYAEAFDGFRYYPNTLAGFNFTEFAVPAILTGRIYDNQQTRAAFLREAYLEESLPVLMQQAGYRAEVYPWRGFANEAVYYREEVASNFKQRPVPRLVKLQELARVLDLAWFRCLPHFAKRWAHDGSEGRLSRAVRSDDQTDENSASAELGANDTIDWHLIEFTRNPGSERHFMRQDAPQPTFKFFHLTGIHVPVKFDRNLVRGQYPYTREAFSGHAEAYAKMMLSFIKVLKSRDLYDQTMIVIVGDHGSGRKPELFLNPGSGEASRQLDAVSSRGSFQRDKARGAPLLLIKPFGAHGPLQRVDTPASAIDVPATVLAAVGAEPSRRPAMNAHPEFTGVPLLEAETEPAVDPSRPRYYGAMRWSKEQSDYVSPISLWRVAGDVWDDRDWSFVEKLAPPAKK